jgi:hypothetical protein
MNTFKHPVVSAPVNVERSTLNAQRSAQGVSRPAPRAWHLILAALALAMNAPAQPAIDWFTLDAGGGAHSSASYVINFTAGQTDVGAAAISSANYRIIPGFWALEDMGPATGLPELSITLSGANVILSWPSPSTGFVLQHTDSLNVLPASWFDTPGLVSDNGFIKSLTLPHNLSKRFYRLRRP